jgi:tRNA(fMet)-specific endonuclease VapC
MTHLLDTCICVSLIRRKSASMRAHFEDFEIGDLGVSAIIEAELRYGADKSLKPEKNHGQLDLLFLTLPVVPFDSEAAAHYGQIRSTLERSGNSIGPLDLLIAANARALSLVLVTNNAGEFSRVPGLEIEDWS